ncbi:MAG: SDR family oxidoreductase [Candidatus Aminicenantes bacterium]|nr:SDR family oxidoreductase [Candidatus Aminicenantes bacterium]
MAGVLVTGGAGFIGSHLVEALVRRGDCVRVLDNFLTGRRDNLDEFRKDVEVLEGDIREPEDCREAVRGMDVVLHQAALPSVPRSVRDPRLTNDINITGTLNMLLAARDAGVASFVFASSSSVYGDDPNLPKTEGREGKPLSPYAVSKLVGEAYVRVFRDLYGLNAVALRYFNIFGPRQDPASQYAAVVPNFVTRLLRGEPPVIYGDGEQSRDFTYVANVVQANLLAAEAKTAGGDAFNIACADRITVAGLALALNRILGTDIPPVHEPARAGDIRHSFADIRKAEAGLSYRPAVAFEDGLRRTVDWYRSRRASWDKKL